MKNKFKVGDKVVANANAAGRYSITKPGWHGEVTQVISDRGIRVAPSQDSMGWVVLAECFDLVKPTTHNKIVITTDGTTTLARLYEGDKVVKRAEAKCSPSDTSNFAVGAELAYARLMDKQGEEAPKYYNGKVVCIKSGYDWWTVGKVYEVKDGIITANDGQTFPKKGDDPYANADDVRHTGCADFRTSPRHNRKNEFIPFVED